MLTLANVRRSACQVVRLWWCKTMPHCLPDRTLRRLIKELLRREEDQKRGTFICWAFIVIQPSRCEPHLSRPGLLHSKNVNLELQPQILGCTAMPQRIFKQSPLNPGLCSPAEFINIQSQVGWMETCSARLNWTHVCICLSSCLWSPTALELLPFIKANVHVWGVHVL